MDHPIVSMALHPLLDEEWLEKDSFAEEYAIEKERLLREAREEVLFSDGTDSKAQTELLELVEKAGVDRRRDGSCDLETACLAVQEDFCILDSSGKMTSGCVCFPSGWKLLDKVGKLHEEIHSPVPCYSSISSGVRGALERLQRPAWRCNWGIRSDARLYVFEGVQRSFPDDPEDLWLMVEKGTLVRLSRTGSLAFGIRVWLVPFWFLKTDARAVSDLSVRLTSETRETLAYKGISADLRQNVLEWASRVTRREERFSPSS